MGKEKINYEEAFLKVQETIIPDLIEKYSKALGAKSKDVRDLERLQERGQLTQEQASAALSSGRHEQAYLAVTKGLVSAIEKLSIPKNVASNENYLNLIATSMEQLAKELRGLANSELRKK